MIDVKDLLRDPDKYRAALSNRGMDPARIDEIVQLHEQLKHARHKAEMERAQRNRRSREFARLKHQKAIQAI